MAGRLRKRSGWETGRRCSAARSLSNTRPNAPTIFPLGGADSPGRWAPRSLAPLKSTSTGFPDGSLRYGPPTASGSTSAGPKAFGDPRFHPTYRPRPPCFSFSGSLERRRTPDARDSESGWRPRPAGPTTSWNDARPRTSMGSEIKREIAEALRLISTLLRSSTSNMRTSDSWSTSATYSAPLQVFAWKAIGSSPRTRGWKGAALSLYPGRATSLPRRLSRGPTFGFDSRGGFLNALTSRFLAQTLDRSSRRPHKLDWLHQIKNRGLFQSSLNSLLVVRHGDGKR